MVVVVGEKTLESAKDMYVSSCACVSYFLVRCSFSCCPFVLFCSFVLYSSTLGFLSPKSYILLNAMRPQNHFDLSSSPSAYMHFTENAYAQKVSRQ